jgi:hypothetical protein
MGANAVPRDWNNPEETGLAFPGLNLLGTATISSPKRANWITTSEREVERNSNRTGIRPIKRTSAHKL